MWLMAVAADPSALPLALARPVHGPWSPSTLCPLVTLLGAHTRALHYHGTPSKKPCLRKIPMAVFLSQSLLWEPDIDARATSLPL